MHCIHVPRVLGFQRDTTRKLIGGVASNSASYGAKWLLILRYGDALYGGLAKAFN